MRRRNSWGKHGADWKERECKQSGANEQKEARPRWLTIAGVAHCAGERRKVGQDMPTNGVAASRVIESGFGGQLAEREGAAVAFFVLAAVAGSITFELSTCTRSIPRSKTLTE